MEGKDDLVVLLKVIPCFVIKKQASKIGSASLWKVIDSLVKYVNVVNHS